jgi:hypothetical protein
MSQIEGVEDIWVSTSKAAKITGYNQEYVRKLARDNAKLTEADRLIKVRKGKRSYDLWLPDLLNYVEKHGLGPYKFPEK